jgi:uncharacterized membrane protein
MTKNLKLIGSFLIVLLLAVFVAAVGDFDIQHLSATSFTVNPGDVISGNISINNTNTTNAITVSFPTTVKLVSSNYNYTTNINYNISTTYSLANNTKEYVSYDITIPSDAYGSSYTANVNITAGTGNWDSFTLNPITVSSNSSLTATDITTSIVKGYNKKESITLTNTGNTNITGITYTKTDLTKGTDTIPSGSIILESVSSIDYKGSATVNATINTVSNQATGVYTGNITTNYGGKSVVSQLTVTIEPVTMSFSAADRSTTWVKGLSSSETAIFTINNTGNVNLTNVNWTIGALTYGGNNLIAGITPDITSTSLTPGESKQVTFTVTGIPANQTVGSYTGDVTFNWGTGNQTNSTLTVNVVNPTYSIITNPTSVTFGNIDQNTNTSVNFNIINNGNAPLSNVNIASTLATRYNLQMSPTSLGTLSVNESRQITVSLLIPEDETTNDHSLGSISLTSNEYNTSFGLYADVRGKLDISDIDVWVDGDSDKNLNDGDSIDEKARPSSTVKFDIRLDNRFSDDDDVKIEDVEVTIIIEEVDDGDDIEDTLSKFDLKPDKWKRVQHEFKLPLNVEEGTYNVVITAEGEDENGVTHINEAKLYLELDKESHEIVISKSSSSPKEVSCGNSFVLDVTATNIGSHSEDEVIISIISTELGVNINEETPELDKDYDDNENKFNKDYTIEVPENKAAGRYPIDIRVYYDTDEISDHVREFITIKACSDSDDDDSTTDTSDDSVTLITGNDGDDTMPPTIQPDVQPWTQDAVDSTTKITFTKSNAYVALLVLANIALVGVVGIMVAKFLFLRP